MASRDTHLSASSLQESDFTQEKDLSPKKIGLPRQVHNSNYVNPD